MYGNEKNFAQIFKIKHEISESKHGVKTVTEYFASLKQKSKWDELAT